MKISQGLFILPGRGKNIPARAVAIHGPFSQLDTPLVSRSGNYDFHIGNDTVIWIGNVEK